MKNRLLLVFFILNLCSTINFAQDLSKIPNTFKSHPEYNVLHLNDQPNSIELIQHRTANSRTFIDKDNKLHTVQTGGVFHFKNNQNEWISIQEKPTKQGGKFGIFQSELPISVDLANGKTSMVLDKKGSEILHGQHVKLNFLSQNLSPIDSKSAEINSTENSGNTLKFNHFFDGIHRLQSFEYWSLQTEYLINQRIDFPENVKYIEIVDEYSLPTNWKIKYNDGEMTAMGWKGNLIITDENNQTVSTISNPFLFDSYQGTTKKSMKGHFSSGAYYIHFSEGSFKIHLRVETDWLNNENLVYPVIIDPTVTNTYTVVQGLEDKNTQYSMNCIATMNVTIPVGAYQVTGTSAEWRIWAKGYIYTDNYADVVEQRSRIGYNQAAPVWSATQNGTGTAHNGSSYNYTAANNGRTYTLNNLNIANGCYNSSNVQYIWQGYQTFYPHTGSAPAAAKVTGCVTNYQELVLNSWKITTTYTEINSTITATPATQTICSGQTTGITLSSTSSSTTTYAWTVNQNGTTGGANGTGSSIAQTLIVNGAPGVATYTITPTFGNCVGTPIDVIINVNPGPTVNAGNDVTICQGQSVTLSASGTTTYQWDQNVVNNTAFVPTTTATYNVIGTENGCVGTDQVTVTVLPVPTLQITADKTEGCLPLTVNFTNNLTNGSTCNWNFGDGQTQNICGPISHTFTSSGCFTISLEIETTDGCIAEQTLTNFICSASHPVAEFEVFPATLTTMNTSTAITNNTQGATSFYWNFGDNQVSSEPNPQHTFPSGNAGTYTVMLIATNSFGCIDTAYQTVIVQEGIIFYVPNAFTPNGDESNQNFKPVFYTGYDPQDYFMKIYNRWGELIFETHDVLYGWDGTYTGSDKIVMDGTYVWQIEFKTTYSDERKKLNGSVTLIR